MLHVLFAVFGFMGAINAVVAYETRMSAKSLPKQAAAPICPKHVQDVQRT